MSENTWLQRAKPRNPVLSNALWERITQEKQGTGQSISAILTDCLIHYLAAPLPEQRPTFRVPLPKARRGISMEDDLWLQLKLRAALESRDMSDLLEDAYRRYSGMGVGEEESISD